MTVSFQFLRLTNYDYNNNDFLWFPVRNRIYVFWRWLRISKISRCWLVESHGNHQTYNCSIYFQWNSTKSVLTIGSGRSAVQYQRTGHGIISCIGIKTNRKSATSTVKESYHPTTSREADRKSTRLNSSHTVISYAVFCLKKKTNKTKSVCVVAPPRLADLNTKHSYYTTMPHTP